WSEPQDVVIANGVIDLQAQVLLGLVVEIVEADGALLCDGEGIEDMVTALDREVCLDAAHLMKRHPATLGRIELRLNVRVGKKDEVEVLRGRLRSQWYMGRGKGGTGAEKREEAAAVDGRHAMRLSHPCQAAINE